MIKKAIDYLTKRQDFYSYIHQIKPYAFSH